MNEFLMNELCDLLNYSFIGPQISGILRFLANEQ